MKKSILVMLVIVSFSYCAFAEVAYSVIGATRAKTGFDQFIAVITRTPDLNTCKSVTIIKSNNFRKDKWRVISQENRVASRSNVKPYENIMKNLPTASNPYLSFKDKSGFETRMYFHGFTYKDAKSMLVGMQKELANQKISAKIIEPLVKRNP